MRFRRRIIIAAASLAALEQDGDGVTAIFADGDARAGDVLIGADGIRSTVRGLCAPESQPLYAGYVAWRALIAESAMLARKPIATSFPTWRSACRRASRCWAIRSPAPTTICGRGICATTWSGTGRPTSRPNWSRC